MLKPFFSIIIPTLNEEKLLPRLLTDIKNLHDDSFEVIIVDGDSQDKTKEAAQRFKDDFHLEFFTNPKRNVAYQRNFGADKAAGTYLIFFDADVRVNKAFLHKLRREVDRTRSLIYIPKYEPIERFFQDTALYAVFNQIIAASQLTSKPFAIGSCMILENNYFHFIGQFDDKVFIAEDIELVQRAKKGGVMAKALSKVAVKVSMRRFKREGPRKLLFKYLVSNIHILRSSKIKNKIYEYEMGGQHYKKDSDSSKNNASFDQKMKNYLRAFKKGLTELTKD